MKTFYKVLHKSAKSEARLGEIKTSHGIIKTPSFIPAATKGTIKSLPPQLIKEIGIQAGCVNTYHLVAHPGADIIEKAGGIHRYSQLNMPLMSDSGGFQVFSLAKNNKVRHANFLSPVGDAKNLVSSPSKRANVRGEEQPLLVKISEDGVKFRSAYDGKLIEFTPEKSMEFQRKIGADINMAFDECIPYGSSYKYSKKAIERTHNWLLRSIRQYQISNIKNQKLYGIIQGGIYEDLRKKSAEFVVSQNTPGIAIGGVSVGETKKEMREQVKWVSDYLPKDRPVHLLGVGQIDDIIDLVKYGVDTFDCVEPTRLARMGMIYKLEKAWDRKFFDGKQQTAKNLIPALFKQIDITKSIYKNNLEPMDKDCNCYVCTNFTKSYLHHLFKQREILGYTLATYHNLWVMERLFDRIRELIVKNKI